MDINLLHRGIPEPTPTLLQQALEFLQEEKEAIRSFSSNLLPRVDRHQQIHYRSQQLVSSYYPTLLLM